MGAGSVKSSDRERLRDPPRPEQAQPLATPRWPGRLPPLPAPQEAKLGTRRARSTQPGFMTLPPGRKTKHQVLSVAVGLLGFLCAEWRDPLAWLSWGGVYQEEMLGDEIN